MSRAKHLTALIFRIVFIVLVFVATMVMSAMQMYSTDQIPIARDFGENNIDVITENGATVEWEAVDGELVFDIISHSFAICKQVGGAEIILE